MSKTALLVMDVQKSILDGIGDQAEKYLDNVKRAVNIAHKSNVPVMYVVVRFREGYPELSPNNKMFASIRENYAQTPMDDSNPSTQPIIKPEGKDLVIAKKRVSAFAGSDLKMILNAQGITNLVLCGIATSGVVLSTLRYAADKDYILSVLSDCCFDRDDEVHRVLTEKVFPRQAEVLTIAEWEEKQDK